MNYSLTEKGADCLLDGVVVTDINGIIFLWNSAMTEYLGIQSDQAKGSAIQKILPYLNKSHIKDRIATVANGGMTAVFSPQLHPEIIKVKREDGKPRKFQLNVALVEQEGERNLLFNFIELTDYLHRIQEMARLKKIAVDELEERKRAEELLAHSERQMRALLNVTQDVIVMIEEDGTINLSNDAFARRFGKSSEELIGRNINELFASDLMKARIKVAHIALETGESQELVDEREGMILQSSIYPVPTKEGETKQVAVYSRDITELRKAEEERIVTQKLRVANLMAATIAHEFNNPLAILKGISQMIKDDLIKEEELKHELINKIPGQVDRMHKLVKQLLEIDELREIPYAANMKILDLINSHSESSDSNPDENEESK